MRFNLVDRILEVEAGKSLRASKYLTLGEEYLADHFPRFPVMPGVLMLQSLVEAATWLLRATTDFKHSITVLREVRGVKYGTFMEPGRCLSIGVDLVSVNDRGDLATFKGKGMADGHQTVQAQFTLVSYNLGDRNPVWQARDAALVQLWKERFALLTETGKPVGVLVPTA